MKKKYLAICLSFILLFLYGCKSQSGVQYEFDNFFGYFESNYSFEKNKVELNGLGYRILSDDIINIYSQKIDDDSDEFKESLIITKKISDKDIHEFSEENMENVDIGGVKFSKGKTVEIDCNDNKLDLLYYQGRYSLNQYNIYVSQGFMKVDNEIYVISFATLDEKHRNSFSSSFKNLQCK